MNIDAFTDRTDALTRRYDDGDERVLVADVGLTADASVDVVEDTVIVVVDTDGDADQYELDAPDGTVSKALINNGVVTIEVER